MDPQTQPRRALPRRQPSQSRSEAKLELIFEAAIRILDTQGLQALTTNRIAEVAGVSIGTLYQYFSNKREILAALAKREVEATVAGIEAALARDTPTSNDERLRAAVRALLNAFGGRHRVRKILLELALANGGREATDAPVQQVVAMLTSNCLTRRPNPTVVLDAMQAFVLAQSVTGAIRAALAHDERWLASAAFEENLICLIHGYLGALAMRAGKFI